MNNDLIIKETDFATLEWRLQSRRSIATRLLVFQKNNLKQLMNTRQISKDEYYS